MTVAAAVPIPGFGLGMASAQGILSDPGASGRASVVLMLENENDAETKNAIQALCPIRNGRCGPLLFTPLQDDAKTAAGLDNGQPS